METKKRKKITWLDVPTLADDEPSFKPSRSVLLRATHDYVAYHFDGVLYFYEVKVSPDGIFCLSEPFEPSEKQRNLFRRKLAELI